MPKPLRPIVTSVVVDVQCPKCQEFIANGTTGALNFSIADGEYVAGAIHPCYGCGSEIKLPKLPKLVKVL